MQQRHFVPRRVPTTFSAPLVRPRATPQHEQEIACLLARTVAFRREAFRAGAEAGPVASCPA